MATPTLIPLDPRTWLAQQPLQENEHLYLIISAASEADALQALRASVPAHPLLPIWSDTPYATWQAVMPYLSKLDPGSAFLSWITETDSLDWGWLAVSRCDPQEVLAHLRSLTQVKMPDGSEVFFRFWDGRFIHPILERLGEAAGEMLPVFERYLINGKCLEVTARKVPAVKDWPWWEVPKSLLDTWAEQDPAILISGLMQWLEEEHSEVFLAWPKANLNLKISRFLKQVDARDNFQQTLLNDLILEQG
jgi:hypothetical protein